MENNKNEIKVSKMENILDDLSLGTKIAIGVVTVTTGILSVVTGIRSWNYKRNNPDQYWENKRSAANRNHQVIADGLNNIADALRNK